VSIPLLYFRTFITLAFDEVAGQFHTLLLSHKSFFQTQIPSGSGGIDINICLYLESKPELTAAQPLPYLPESAFFNPLNADLNPICYLLALLGAHMIFHVSRIRVN
jgi:hypothetical protein